MSSNQGPLEQAPVAQVAAEVVRKAHAVGLVDRSPDFHVLTFADVRRTVARISEAGIAARAAGVVQRREPAQPAELVRALREIDARLEESPLPATEWPRVEPILEAEPLASLLGISQSSLQRYAKGERRTPDDIAARLHMLALAVGDLAGAYNDIGIRRWFTRPRTALAGRAPAALLRGNWRPEDEGPRQVRALARALVTPSAT